MRKPASHFVVLPPCDLNSEIVRAAGLLEAHLEKEFPGYRFEVVDLRDIKPVEPGQPVEMGDGDDYAVIPVLGQANCAPGTGFLSGTPERGLVYSMVLACRAFDPVKARKLAA